MFNKILIATHGTKGARKAELYAIRLARAFDAELLGLYVIHKGWSSLVGIEWLHASHVRMEFYRYAESQFHQRANQVLDELRSRTEGIKIVTSVRVGEPTDVIAEEAEKNQAEIIVVGTDSSERSEEYRARISIKKLIKKAPCPVLVVNGASAIIQEGGDHALFRLSTMS